MLENESSLFWLLVAVLGAIVAMILIVYFVQWLIAFQEELKHVNTEIQRTTGRERERWKRRKRRLFLSIIPFVRY